VTRLRRPNMRASFAAETRSLQPTPECYAYVSGARNSNSGKDLFGRARLMRSPQ
jgi:hypothetical protein